MKLKILPMLKQQGFGCVKATSALAGSMAFKAMLPAKAQSFI
jgi:hypothetical protein